MSTYIRCGRFKLSLERPLIMAILNLTPDSFSGDGRAGASPDEVMALAERALDEGADILDIGGESTRPGAAPVSTDEELARVVPVVERLHSLGVPLSVDTMKPQVMRAAITAGCDLINDIQALRMPGAIEAVAGTDVGVCLMHMQGEPRTMQAAPQYVDVVADVSGFLSERLAVLRAAGFPQDQILLDPGFGFGKTLEHNLALFRALPGFCTMAPVLVGVSRKSMLGQITGRAVGDRVMASAAAAILAAQRGAAVLRVHDVAATRDALAVLRAIER